MPRSARPARSSKHKTGLPRLAKNAGRAMTISTTIMSFINTSLRRLKKICEYLNKRLSKYYEGILNLFKNKKSYLAIINKNKFNFIITHDLGGGSDFYLQELLKTQKDACLILISHPFGYKIKYQTTDQQFWFLLSSLKEFEQKINCKNITSIFVNNYVRGRDPLKLIDFLTQLKRKYNPHLTIPIHDFFAICPSYPLIDQNKKYCGVPDNISICENCRLSNSYNKYKKIPISVWRAHWVKLLRSADDIKCFSRNSHELLLKAYPSLAEQNVTIKPHRVDHIHSVIQLKYSTQLHIGIVGNISSHHKGVTIVKEMLTLINKNKLNIHITIIGSAFQLSDNTHLTITGHYQREHLAEIISSTSINVFFLPSIWPETFSYVTHELMRLQLPIAVFDLGAQAEAIKNYQYGHIIPEMSAHAALQQLIKAQ